MFLLLPYSFTLYFNWASKRSKLFLAKRREIREIELCKYYEEEKRSTKQCNLEQDQVAVRCIVMKKPLVLCPTSLVTYCDLFYTTLFTGNKPIIRLVTYE